MITKTQERTAIVLFVASLIASMYSAYIYRGREIGIGIEFAIPFILLTIYLFIFCNNEEDPTSRRHNR